MAQHQEPRPSAPAAETAPPAARPRRQLIAVLPPQPIDQDIDAFVAMLNAFPEKPS